MLPDWYNIGTRPKQLSFTFNKDRQVEKIVDDSTTAPFEFDIKDSGKVVTIHSNYGSYKEVVKPLFSSLTKGSLFVTERYNVTCVQNETAVDQRNSEAHIKLTFNISPRNKPPDEFAFKVTVHVYHSSRRVLIRGGKLFDSDETVSI